MSKLFYVINNYSFLFLMVISMNIQAQNISWMKESQTKLEKELVYKYGESQRARVQRGLKQVAEFWRSEDGDSAVFDDFVRTNFAGDMQTLDAMFSRFESLLEKLYGHMNEIKVEFRRQLDLDKGNIHAFDEIFAGYSPTAHITEDFFRNKLAFIVLLNFPLTTLQERLENGDKWSRREWAEVRLAQRFSKRIPAEVNQAVSKAEAETDQYISEYNIYAHHLLDENSNRLFPAKMRLLSHWNLRDELKANYADQNTGFAKQKIIQKVMERIIDQTIPKIVINNPYVDWNPYTNDVKVTNAYDFGEPKSQVEQVSNSPELDNRYAMLLKAFHASRKVDPYSPTAPTLIARKFDEEREIPKERVKAILEEVLTSPLIAEIAKVIESKLGRPLEPFDIWYNGFRSSGKYSESELDKIVKKRYPTIDAFKKDIPNILMKLGFSKERAKTIASNIEVEPARGSGHAWGGGMQSAKARLRTRVPKDGMDYKGFNIAIHELGHNVEQTISMNEVDHFLLNGVPNTAFTEAIAFYFQNRDLELLGLSKSSEKDKAMKTLNDFWMTYEIAGVSLVDMEIWEWLYAHPDASPIELKKAVLQIAKDIWNKYYSSIFKQKDVTLLAIYSHIIHSFLYIPDYAIGHLISHQIEEHLSKSKKPGQELERILKLGCVAPDVWMKNATASLVGAEALLVATDKALAQYKNK